MGNYMHAHLLSMIITLSVYYFLDMGADLKLAIEFYREGHYFNCWITVGLSASAMYLLNALGCYWEARDYGMSWRSLLFYILPYGLLYQRLRCLAILLPGVFYPEFKIKGYNIHHLLIREDWKAVILALIQTFASNAIHITWQLHWVLHDSLTVDSLTWWTRSSVLLSIISCSLALSDYHLARRTVLGIQKPGTYYSIIAFILTHFSTFCILATRFISATLILSSPLYYIFIGVIMLHLTLAIASIVKWDFNLFYEVKLEPETEVDSPSFHGLAVSKATCCTAYGSFLFSLLFLVTHLETIHKEKIIFVHFCENVVFLLVWYLTVDVTDTWHLWFLCGIIVINIVGISVCFVIWLTCFLKDKKRSQKTAVITEMVPLGPEVLS